MSKTPIQVIKSLILFLSATPGRDKSCRLIQYTCRFLAAALKYHIAQGNLGKEQYDVLTKRIESLSSNMSLTRKVLRFGRPIGCIVSSLDLAKQLNNSYNADKDDIKQNPVYIYSKIGSLLSLCAFFLLDHVTYFDRVNLMDKRQKLVSDCDYFSSVAWIFDCLFGLVASSMEIQYLLNKKKQQQVSRYSLNAISNSYLFQQTSSDRSFSENKETFEKLQYQIEQTGIELVRNFIDIPVAIGLMYPNIVSSGSVGILGAITSFIGCYQNWK